MPLLRPRVTTRADVEAWASSAHNLVGVATEEEKEDDYLKKLIKYIPGEIVAAYLFLFGALGTVASNWAPVLSLVWVGALAVLTVLWIPYATSDKEKGKEPHAFQTWSAVVAFLVWAFALGGRWLSLLPDGFQQVQPVIGSMAVVMTTLVIPLVDRSR